MLRAWRKTHQYWSIWDHILRMQSIVQKSSASFKILSDLEKADGLTQQATDYIKNMGNLASKNASIRVECGSPRCVNDQGMLALVPMSTGTPQMTLVHLSPWRIFSSLIRSRLCVDSVLNSSKLARSRTRATPVRVFWTNIRHIGRIWHPLEVAKVCYLFQRKP